MAEFTSTPQAQAPGSYVGLSEGIRSSANTGLGNLFEGLANVLDAGVKEQDRNIKANIEKDIFDEVDSVQAEFGVPEATDLQNQPEDTSFSSTPAGVQRSVDQLQTLQTAFQQGKLKESHYWARLNSVVRQLRGKYPGYRGEIDQMVSGVTGAKPANALRSALMSEWAESQQKASEYDKLVERAAFAGHLPADFYQRAAGANPYTPAELTSYVAGRAREEQDTSAKRAALGLQADQDNLNQKDAERMWRTEANSFVTNLLGDASSAAGASYQDLAKKINEAQTAFATGKPLSDVEVNQLRTQMGQLKATVQLALNQKMISSWDGNPDHSYGTQLSKEQQQAVIDQAMQPITIIENALSSENPWGVLKSMASVLDATKNEVTKDFIQNVPVAKEMMAVESVLGSAGLGQYLTLSGKLQASLDQALIDYSSLNAARAMSNGTTVADAAQDGLAKERGKPYYDGLMDTWKNKVDAFAKGELSDDMMDNNVQYMFGPGAERAMSVFDDASKFEYFKKVASPAVSNQMIKYKQRGGEEAYDKYQRFVLTSFESLFRTKVQSVQDLVLDPNFYRVTYDQNSSRFKVDMRVTSDTFVGAPISQSSINQLNDAIQVIKPIIKEGGGDANMEVLSALARMGFDPDAQAQDTRFGPGLMKAVIDNIRANVSSEGESDLLTPVSEVMKRGQNANQ